ncbi:MAG TPA: methyl-accepting chemotaxis protein [Spirochaetota bacterium]|nr:methyl-accepting chemotaxis protein [Spirochaetota bacterium]HOM38863.1 methyl-accepting chemotaxis protein [Spirochaetota bacterium]HPQ49158.1 methyl-accepting chemotaxis protein [Spirochaetota bacterium]
MKKLSIIDKIIIISILSGIILFLLSYILLNKKDLENIEKLDKNMINTKIKSVNELIDIIIRIEEDRIEQINQEKMKELKEKVEWLQRLDQFKIDRIKKIFNEWKEPVFIINKNNKVIFTNNFRLLTSINLTNIEDKKDIKIDKNNYSITKIDKEDIKIIILKEKDSINYEKISEKIIKELNIDIMITLLEDKENNKKGTIIYYNDRTYIGKSIIDIIQNRNIISNIYTLPSGIISYRDERPKKIGFTKIEKLNWVVSYIIEEPEKSIKNNLIQSSILGILTVILTFILVSIFSYYSYIIHINDITKAVEKTRTGEITKISDSKIPKGKIGFFIKNINLLISKLEEIILQLMYVLKNIFTSMEKINDGNKKLSERTQKQASSLEEVGTAVEELTATAKNNVNNMENAKKLAQDTKLSAEEGGEIVYEAVSKINELEKNSRDIKDIIGVIEEIAFQTNLLALNASVEAARAGEEGKGFAVVASEIRKLAKKTSGFAKQINQIITNTTSNISSTTILVNNSGIALQKIIDNITELTNFIEELTAAFEEERKGVEEIQIAIIDLQKINQENAELADNVANLSNNILEKIQMLESIISFFNIAKSHIIKKSPKIDIKNIKVENVIETDKNIIEEEGELEEF